jgi:hypothetical protein
VVVLLVHLEVLGQVVDAIGQERDLDLGGTGVAVVLLELRNRVALGRQVGGLTVGHVCTPVGV